MVSTVNKTYIKTVLRTVRSTMSRFLAIFAIVALGVGFLAGLLSSPVDMRVSADHYYDETNLYDIRLLSTLGLTEEDLEQVRQVEGVATAMPIYDTDLVLVSQEGDNYTTRMHSLPQGVEEGSSDYLNQLVLQEGRMPEKAGECVIVLTQSLTEEKNWIGETLRQDPDNPVEEMEDTFTVVGTVKSSAYISVEQEHTTVGSGTLNLLAYTVPESFSYDYYTGFYLAVEDTLDLNSFSQEYKDKVAAVTDRLEPLGEERSQIRYQDLIDEANEELDDARAKYEDAKAEADAELADALQQLEDGQQELDENRQTLEDAQAEIQDGWAQLEQKRKDSQAQIASAQQEINNGYTQIQDYQAQLDSGMAQVQEAQKQLDAGYASLTENQQTLENTKAQLDETKTQLDSLTQGKEQLWQAVQAAGFPVTDTSDQAALTVIGQLEQLSPEMGQQFAPLKTGLEALAAEGTDTDSALAAWESGNAQYQEGLAAFEAAKEELDQNQAALDQQLSGLYTQQATLNDKKAQLDASYTQLQQSTQTAQTEFANAEAQLNDAQVQYDEGMAQLEEGQKELDQGREEYEDAKAEAEEKLSDAEEKIKDGESQVRDIEEGEWYIFTRDDNTSYASYGSNADKIAAIATVFPLFFFLVAALVALTTMTRMVEEERQQIGTLKALGYSPLKIAAKYLFYAAFASIAGCVLGLAVGTQLFPTVIINAYNIMYDVPDILTPFHFTYALVSSLAAVVCTLGATLSACWAELREVAARLMLPKAPKAGKRIFLEHITPLWSRLKFTQKVTARNLIRYKKRFFMTVIGIAGCTALLVTGFGIRDSISDIVDLQFGQLNQYQLTVGLKDESALEGRDLQEILSDTSRIRSYLAVSMDDAQVVPTKNHPKDDVTLMVPSDVEEFTQYFQFRHRTNSQPVTFDEDAVIITEKLSERQNLRVGDTITLENGDGVQASLTITDICENYVYHYVYLSPNTYEKAFGSAPANNAVLCMLPEDENEGTEDALTTDLLKCRDVSGAQFTTELSRSFDNTIQSIDYIVVVLIISAGALAFVVLYNLTNINITEREKELATIKVLGFYDGEVSAYIYRETALLTLIGTAAGLVLGIFLHQFVIRTAEVDMVMFGRSIYWPSFVWAALLTLFFSMLVNLVMHRKLKKISMVESMKAPE